MTRSSLIGDRVEVVRIYHRCKPGGKNRYIDYTSMYPWVNFKGKYPVGHPKKILRGEQCSEIEDLTPYEGLIQCRILPKQNM